MIYGMILLIVYYQQFQNRILVEIKQILFRGKKGKI